MKFLNHHRLAVLALTSAGVLWGASFLFAKFAFAELPVSQVVLYRSALASLALLPVACVQRVIPSWRDILLFVLVGVLMVPVTFLLQFTGLLLTSASSASLIIGCLPPMLAIATTLLSHERLTGLEWGAVALSSVGMAFLVGLPGANHNWIGDGLVFLSLFAVIAWVMLSKHLIRRYPPIATTAYLLFFGTLILCPVSWAIDGAPRFDLSVRVWGAIMAGGLLCTAATYALWNWGLQYARVTHAGVYVNLEPLTGAFLGVVVLNEALSLQMGIGGTLIILAAVLVSIIQGQRQALEQGAEVPAAQHLSDESDIRLGA